MADKAAEAVATYIMQYKCIANLNLSNNLHLGPVGVKGIASVLSEDIALERLDLSGCDVGGEGAAALGAMLKANRGLRCLVLANTRLGAQGEHPCGDYASHARMTAIIASVETVKSYLGRDAQKHITLVCYIVISFVALLSVVSSATGKESIR
ncbi:hypothetical protein Vretimale_11851 [Volvox reticuliferus]|uniref:Uncharacterized protein n=1 Tax=Volvox reticuliferus TaxID=1737510 RepID=A0A8J4GHC3_9CHLO|nr:hypothetical protein Vretimale_11851 [Volvox reticuliferus]